MEEIEKGYYFENMQEFILYAAKNNEPENVKIIWKSGEAYHDEYFRGYKYFEQGNLQAALASYLKCIELNPVGIGARFELVETYLQMQRIPDAKAQLLALAAYLTNRDMIAKFYRRMGYVYTEEKDYKTAVACYKFSKTFQDSPMVASELNYIHSKGGSIFMLGSGKKYLEAANIPILKEIKY